MRTWRDERGMTSLSTVLAASFALVVFLALGNLILVQYGRGVARAAVDEAVRRGSVLGNCADTAQAVLDDLIGGPFGADLVVECEVNDGVVVASVSGLLPALVPFLPDFAVRATASALMEEP
jgi:hypothetical protein